MTAFRLYRAVLPVLAGGLLCLPPSPSHAVNQVCVKVTVGVSNSSDPTPVEHCTSVPIRTQCDVTGGSQQPLSVEVTICY